MLPGFRAVLLSNGYSESVELASLLVHVEMRNPQVTSLPAADVTRHRSSWPRKKLELPRV